MNSMNWPSPKPLLREHLTFAALSTLGLFATIAAIAFGYDRWSGDAVDRSFWVDAAAGITPPYALGVGIYLTAVTFPRYVLYGETRKRFAQRVALFSVPFAFALTLLAYAGFLAEEVLYQVAGWNHTAEGRHLFDSARDVTRFVFEFFFQILPWFAFGALFGAMYRSSQRLLIAAIPLGLIAVVLVNMLLGLDDGPSWLARSVLTPAANTLVAAIVSLAATVAALWAVRAVTRSMPIQSQQI